MKKFVFTMQKMRDYKKQILESEKNKLMTLRKEQYTMENRISELDENMLSLGKRQTEAMLAGTKSSDLILFNMQKDGIRREKIQLSYQLNILLMTIERQRKAVVKISQEVSGLDKLEEQQREEYNKLAAKESQNAIEEFLSFKLSAQKTC